MTRNEILRRFPKASDAFIRANLDADDCGLCPAVEKSVERLPLESVGESENPHWYDAAKCFEVELIVYSVRPADYDAYDVKALQDFCVKIGIIPEDRWDVVVCGSIRSRKAATEGEEKTIFKIKALTVTPEIVRKEI